jgi:peptidoglycan/LPS O-acetylase OafA/YrhL
MHSKLEYRPEIDTLRAISVFAVIIYHAGFYNNFFFPGGYLGVDIFFVISGYLISKLIFKEVFKTKKFNFKNFYERRARRILPALIFVFLITLLLSYFILLPSSFVDFAKSIISSLSFLSNYYFYFSGQEYASEGSHLKPLLHTWSLSVEEQFYIIFPIILLIVYNHKKNYIFLFIFLTCILSLIFSEYLSETNESLNFYTLPTRAWEILMGTLVSYSEYKRKKSKTTFANELLVLIGLLIVVLSFVFYDESVRHPTFRSLYPVIGVLLILYFANPEVKIVKFLSLKLFTYFGLISYSLYLWHYPIFALSKYAFLTNSLSDYLIIFLILFFVSIFSYHFIERPFRSSLISLRTFLYVISFSYFILFLSSSLVIKNNGYKKRFPDLGSFSLDNQQYIKERRFVEKKIGTPLFKNQKKKNVLIVGNSHAQDLFHSLYLNKDLFNKFEFSKISTDNLFCFKKFLTENKFCNIPSSKKIKNLFELTDTILIAPNYKNNAQSFKNLEDIILILKNMNKKVFLVSQMPNFYFKNNRTSIDQFYFKYNRLPNKFELSNLEKEKFNLIPVSVEKINNNLQILSKKYNLKLLDRKELICEEILKKCYILTKSKNKINIDSDHLSIAGAIFVGKRILQLNWLNIN